jgi:hypothetical protein
MVSLAANADVAKTQLKIAAVPMAFIEISPVGVIAGLRSFSQERAVRAKGSVPAPGPCSRGAPLTSSGGNPTQSMMTGDGRSLSDHDCRFRFIMIKTDQIFSAIDGLLDNER